MSGGLTRGLGVGLDEKPWEGFFFLLACRPWLQALPQACPALAESHFQTCNCAVVHCLRLVAKLGAGGALLLHTRTRCPWASGRSAFPTLGSASPTVATSLRADPSLVLDWDKERQGLEVCLHEGGWAIREGFL